uniref:Uncharacterized protein n=1 Tax=Anguilla anguilla TaxID=7936 RepID=A0A0E9R812_ANGAN
MVTEQGCATPVLEGQCAGCSLFQPIIVA